MSKFYLIRHSITKGNLEKRYIGAKTDEPLCKAGYELLKEKHYPKVEKVIASPMKRCIETAQLLFPDTQIQIEESLRECDFGEFENKNYQELSQSKAYQAWIDSNGTLPFPNGESQESFRKLSSLATKEKDYFCWQVKNAEGFLVEVTKEEWENTRKVTVIKEINGKE